MKMHEVRLIRKIGRMLVGVSSISLMAFMGMMFIFKVPATESAPLHPSLTTVASLKEDMRPRGVPVDYLITPNGYFSADCVQVAHAHETLLSDGSIRQADGTIRASARCGRPHYDFHGNRIEPAGARPSLASFSESSVRLPSYTGWIESVSYNNGSNVGRLRATWNVPSAPANVSGQTVFFFPGLEQLPNVQSILQPVLGWNGFGDNSWTIASWNCCVNGTTTHTDPVGVSPGDQIIGDEYSLCGVGVYDCGSWSIVTQDASNGQSVTLNTTPNGELQWVFGGVLEVYGIASCDQFPSQGVTQFYGVTVWDTNGNVLSPPWQGNFAGSSISPQCGYNLGADTSDTYMYY